MNIILYNVSILTKNVSLNFLFFQIQILMSVHRTMEVALTLVIICLAPSPANVPVDSFWVSTDVPAVVSFSMSVCVHICLGSVAKIPLKHGL